MGSRKINYFLMTKKLKYTYFFFEIISYKSILRGPFLSDKHISQIREQIKTERHKERSAALKQLRRTKTLDNCEFNDFYRNFKKNENERNDKSLKSTIKKYKSLHKKLSLTFSKGSNRDITERVIEKNRKNLEKTMEDYGFYSMSKTETMMKSDQQNNQPTQPLQNRSKGIVRISYDLPKINGNLEIDDKICKNSKNGLNKIQSVETPECDVESVPTASESKSYSESSSNASDNKRVEKLSDRNVNSDHNRSEKSVIVVYRSSQDAANKSNLGHNNNNDDDGNQSDSSSSLTVPTQTSHRSSDSDHSNSIGLQKIHEALAKFKNEQKSKEISRGKTQHPRLALLNRSKTCSYESSSHSIRSPNINLEVYKKQNLETIMKAEKLFLDVYSLEKQGQNGNDDDLLSAKDGNRNGIIKRHSGRSKFDNLTPKLSLPRKPVVETASRIKPLMQTLSLNTDNLSKDFDIFDFNTNDNDEDENQDDSNDDDDDQNTSTTRSASKRLSNYKRDEFNILNKQMKQARIDQINKFNKIRPGENQDSSLSSNDFLADVVSRSSNPNHLDHRQIKHTYFGSDPKTTKSKIPKKSIDIELKESQCFIGRRTRSGIVKNALAKKNISVPLSRSKSTLSTTKQKWKKSFENLQKLSVFQNCKNTNRCENKQTNGNYNSNDHYFEFIAHHQENQVHDFLRRNRIVHQITAKNSSNNKNSVIPRGGSEMISSSRATNSKHKQTIYREVGNKNDKQIEKGEIQGEDDRIFEGLEPYSLTSSNFNREVLRRLYTK